VFEDKKPIIDDPSAYKILFTQVQPFPAGTPGGIVRSSTPFNKTAIPLAFITLDQCAVLSVHFHPLGSEQLLVVQGSIEVGMFSEDQKFRLVQVNQGEAVLIPQGAVHYVRNTGEDGAVILQMFDHPLAGAQFVGPALLNMPKDVLGSAFAGAFPAKTTGNIFKMADCPVA
jgi:quercetin dioxygenase-like cupin family protein